MGAGRRKEKGRREKEGKEKRKRRKGKREKEKGEKEKGKKEKERKEEKKGKVFRRIRKKILGKIGGRQKGFLWGFPVLTVYFGTPNMFIPLWFGFVYGTNPPLGTLII
jgi:hypothetical protein